MCQVSHAASYNFLAALVYLDFVVFCLCVTTSASALVCNVHGRVVKRVLRYI